MGLLVSVIIPTYNREKLLAKCLSALAGQTFPAEEYEVIVIDDGSTDGTPAMVKELARKAPCCINYVYKEHKGIGAARNVGLRLARGELIIFIDSDIVAVPDFIQAHVSQHKITRKAGSFQVDDNFIVHGPVIYTTNLDNPLATKKRVTDISTAFFATTNVSIAKKWLFEAGLFDEDFTEYGWEDLELGQRLRRLGLMVIRSEEPKGYHLKHEFSLSELPGLLQKERERGHMAVLYYRKHPTFKVRMATMLTPAFFALVRLLTLGDWPSRKATLRLMRFLEKRQWRLPLAVLLQIVLYHAYAAGMREALRRE